MIFDPVSIQNWLNDLGRCPTGQELYELIKPEFAGTWQDGYDNGRYDATPDAS